MRNNSKNTNENFLGEYFGQIRQTLIYLLAWGMFVVLGSCLAGNIFLIPGFLMGFISSIFYYILMFRRVKKSADMPARQAVTYMRYGWFIRFGFILAVLIISLKIPGVDFRAMVIGLFSLKIVLIVQAALVVAAGLIAKTGR